VIDPALGYDPDDQFWYSRKLVAELLPLAVYGPEPPARGLTDSPGGKGDPAEGGNMLAMILDVRRALSLMGAGRRAAIEGGVTAGQDTDAVDLDLIVDLLGGPKP
jgi:hypothetical protein